MVGDQAEAFHAAEAKASLSDKVVPIKSVPMMYVCMEGTGVPVVKKETAGRQGKGEDGQAKTRDAKLGCVFIGSSMLFMKASGFVFVRLISR